MTLTKEQVAKAFIMLQNYEPQLVCEYFGVDMSTLWKDLSDAEQLGFSAWRN